MSGWQTEGKAFSYFSDNAKRIAYLTRRRPPSTGACAPPRSNDDYADCIDTGGTVGRSHVYRAYFAPASRF